MSKQTESPMLPLPGTPGAPGTREEMAIRMELGEHQGTRMEMAQDSGGAQYLCILTREDRTAERWIMVPGPPRDFQEWARLTAESVVVGDRPILSFIGNSDWVLIQDRPKGGGQPTTTLFEPHVSATSEEDLDAAFGELMVGRLGIEGTAEERQERWNAWRRKVAQAGIGTGTSISPD